jgi:hypothetical protein
MHIFICYSNEKQDKSQPRAAVITTEFCVKAILIVAGLIRASNYDCLCGGVWQQNPVIGGQSFCHGVRVQSQ